MRVNKTKSHPAAFLSVLHLRSLHHHSLYLVLSWLWWGLVQWFYLLLRVWCSVSCCYFLSKVRSAKLFGGFIVSIALPQPAPTTVLLPFGNMAPGITVNVGGVGPDGRTTFIASATVPQPDTPIPSELLTRFHPSLYWVLIATSHNFPRRTERYNRPNPIIPNRRRSRTERDFCSLPILRYRTQWCCQLPHFWASTIYGNDCRFCD